MAETIPPLKLREAFNVADLKKRDKFVRQIRKIRRDAVLDKNTIECWNEQHPNETPIDSSWCQEVIDWCDGKAPLPMRDEE